MRKIAIQKTKNAGNKVNFEEVCESHKFSRCDAKIDFLLRVSDSLRCTVCGKVDDVHLLLMDCVRFQAARKILMRTLSLHSISLSMFHEVLSTPLSETSRYIFRPFNIHILHYKLVSYDGIVMDTMYEHSLNNKGKNNCRFLYFYFL